jgi:hypothetical protein
VLLTVYIYKDFVAVFENARLAETLNGTAENIVAALLELVRKKKNHGIRLFASLCGAQTTVVNVSKLSEYDVYLLKRHAKKTESREHNKVFLGAAMLKNAQGKQLLVTFGTMSDLSMRVVNEFEKAEVPFRQFFIQQFYAKLQKGFSAGDSPLTDQADEPANFLQRGILSFFRSSGTSATSWECSVFPEYSLFPLCDIQQSTTQQEVQSQYIVVKYNGKIALLREVLKGAEDLVSEIIQTHQYIKTIGYNDESFLIRYPDNAPQQNSADHSQDSTANSIAGPLTEAFAEHSNVKIEPFDEAAARDALFSRRNAAPLLIRTRGLEIVSCFFFVLCCIGTINNLSRVSGEAKLQRDLLSRTAYGYEKKLPLSPSGFAKKQKKATYEALSLDLWKYKAGQTWCFSNFKRLFELLLANAHQNSFLINLEYHVVHKERMFHDSVYSEHLKLNNLERTNRRKKREASNNLEFIATFSPAIFYNDSSKSMSAPQNLRKEIRKFCRSVKKELAANLHRLKIKGIKSNVEIKTEKTFQVAVKIPDPTEMGRHNKQ